MSQPPPAQLPAVRSTAPTKVKQPASYIDVEAEDGIDVTSLPEYRDIRQNARIRKITRIVALISFLTLCLLITFDDKSPISILLGALTFGVFLISLIILGAMRAMEDTEEVAIGKAVAAEKARRQSATRQAAFKARRAQEEVAWAGRVAEMENAAHRLNLTVDRGRSGNRGTIEIKVDHHFPVKFKPILLVYRVSDRPFPSDDISLIKERARLVFRVHDNKPIDSIDPDVEFREKPWRTYHYYAWIEATVSFERTVKSDGRYDPYREKKYVDSRTIARGFVSERIVAQPVEKPKKFLERRAAARQRAHEELEAMAEGEAEQPSDVATQVLAAIEQLKDVRKQRAEGKRIIETASDLSEEDRERLFALVLQLTADDQ